MRAVVIASPTEGEFGVDPSRRVAGVGLALRAVLTLEGRGVEAIGIVGSPDLVAELRADPRLSAEVTVHEGPLTERALVTRCDQVVAPRVFDQLLGSDEGRVAVAGDHGAGPAVLLAGDDVALPTPGDDTVLRDDTVLGGEAVQWLSPDDFVHDVSDEAGRRAATRALFEACRKPVDGVVSRNLNRHVSLFVSRLLVDTPVTPNAMTVVTFGVSVVASWLALEGTYAAFAVAGVLMQLNSILDGCDGELARVRFQGSKIGQWLDTVGDDLSNVIFWAAVAYGSRTVPDWGPWLAGAGWLAAGANGLSALLNYAVLAQKGSGDFYALMGSEGDTERGGISGLVVAFFSTVLRQDFFLFLVMIVALVGWLPWALPVIALGAVITLGVSAVRTAQFFRGRGGLQPNRR